MVKLNGWLRKNLLNLIPTEGITFKNLVYKVIESYKENIRLDFVEYSRAVDSAVYLEMKRRNLNLTMDDVVVRI